MRRVTETPNWRFFAAAHRAAPAMSAWWWLIVVARGALPPLLGVLSGWLIQRITDDGHITAPLVALAVTFVAAQVVGPIHEALSYDLGERTATAFNDRLLELTTGPAGIAHLERSDLAADLSMARDFDLGVTGPPLSVSMSFIADGVALFVVGVVSAIVLVTQLWWAPFVLVAAWLSTHYLLKESGVWQDRQTPEVQLAQRQADYSYRLAVDAPAAKEVRLFGLGPWIVQRFGDQREQLYRMQYDATRLRERSTLISLAVVLGANVAVFWVLADRLADGRTGLGGAIVAVTAALGVSGIAFGGLTWAMDGAAAPAAAIERLAAVMPAAGALSTDGDAPMPGSIERGPEIRFRDVTFGYADGPPVLQHFDLTVPAGRSIAIVGQNGAGKTTLAKLICRLYDPNGGAIEIDGHPLVELDVVAWRRQVTAVFQDFVRFELTLRENVTTDLGGTAGGASDVVDADVRAALVDAGAAHLAELDTPLAKAYPGGTDLSGGQWQRVALARALYAVRTGARVVLLDEPTAQLDVKGEAEIFDRVLRATAAVDCTTILVSHRFSTVRRADLICVMEHGRVIELGTHAELMRLGGRYRTMFDLQAARFAETGDVIDGDDADTEVGLDTLD